MKYCQKNGKKKKSTRNLNKELDDSCDSRGDDEETAISRFFPGHQNRLRIPVDDDENDRDVEYGKEFNRRTAEAQSPELERKARTPSAKKSRDRYDHFLCKLINSCKKQIYLFLRYLCKLMNNVIRYTLFLQDVY